MVDVKMEPSWKEVLKDELSAPYFERLTNAVKLEYKTNRCFPEAETYSEPLIYVRLTM